MIDAMETSASKEWKLLFVKNRIQQVASFLAPYLPLANAHNSDFILCRHWETLVPQSLAQELLSLDDHELCLISTNNMEAVKSSHQGIAHHPPQNDFKTCCARQVFHMPEKFDESESILRVPCETDSMSSNADVNDHPRADVDDEMQAFSAWTHKTLAAFVQMAVTNSLPNLHVLTPIDEMRTQLDIVPEKDRVVVTSFMKPKKSYEIDIMSAVCAELAKKYSVTDAVDIGTGRGYLGCHLALMYNLRVLGIDSSASNTKSAVTRTRHLQKQWHKLSKNAQKRNVREDSDSSSDKISCDYSGTDSGRVLATSADDCIQLENAKKTKGSVSCAYKPVTMFVNGQTDLSDLINAHWCRTAQPPLSFILTGLHTCGNLSADLLRLFASTSSAIAVCQVGCCYNLLCERFAASVDTIRSCNGISSATESGFPMCELLNCCGFRLGRNARMLASQSPERTASALKLPPMSIHWRSLLQVVLRDALGYVQDDWCVGKISSKCQSFEEYARKAFTNLGVTCEITDGQLADYTLRYHDHARKNIAFFTLRTLLGPCIEALVLLDRLAFLLEQNDVTDAYIVPMFDAVLSPRRFALVAVKS